MSACVYIYSTQVQVLDMPIQCSTVQSSPIQQNTNTKQQCNTQHYTIHYTLHTAHYTTIHYSTAHKTAKLQNNKIQCKTIPYHTVICPTRFTFARGKGKKAELRLAMPPVSRPVAVVCLVSRAERQAKHRWSAARGHCTETASGLCFVHHWHASGSCGCGMDTTRKHEHGLPTVHSCMHRQVP